MVGKIYHILIAERAGLNMSKVRGYSPERSGGLKKCADVEHLKVRKEKSQEQKMM